MGSSPILPSKIIKLKLKTMKKLLLTLVLVLVTTIGYSQRNFSIGVQYDISTNEKVEDFECKFSYWVTPQNKLVIEFEGVAYDYGIQNEIKGSTKSGYKYTTYYLVPYLKGDKYKQLQVFEDKEYGIRLYIFDSQFYYQFFD